MAEQKERKITRREMIKATGLVALGLVYTKPFVETIYAKSAFEGYENGDFAGLTPGFWKQSHHFDNWTGYEPNGDNVSYYNDVFQVDAFDGNTTLLDALKQGGGDEKALGRHAVAGLLNAANPDINYLYTTSEVIALVQQAYLTREFEAAKNLLEAQNELENGG